MMSWEILVLPFIGALIGWLTNVVAIKMLFWPNTPVRIPILGIELLGLLPKRKEDLAVSVGSTVERDLLPIEDVLGMIDTGGYGEHLVEVVVTHIDERLREVLPRILPENVKDMIRHYSKEIVAKESRLLIHEVSEGMMDKFREEASLGNLVAERVRSLDLADLEALVNRIARQELRYIEFLGALLGFVIGVLQSAFLVWRLRG